MAPLTRYRAPGCIPGNLMAIYYEQRASKGGLLISEATSISETCGLPVNNPRIDTLEAIEGWRSVVERVHKKGAFIYCQLNHYGRAGDNEANGINYPLYCSSPVPISGLRPNGRKYAVPKEMDEDNIQQVIQDFVNAAAQSIHMVGFDGVELHGANGYLIDQFLEDNINQRADQYGGSIENRCRFPLMILDAVIAKVGSDKVGFRISPWDTFQDANDSDPFKHFSYLCEQLEKRKISYVHIVEARSDANGGRENDSKKSKEFAEFLLESSAASFKNFLPNTPIISAGGWNDSNLDGIIESSKVDALAFGRYFISNPDLPEKLKRKIPLSKYDRKTFYDHLLPIGYIDYPIFM